MKCAVLLWLAGTAFAQTNDLQVEFNAVRRVYNLPELTVTPELTCAAVRHAQDLDATDECSHLGSDGSTFASRAKDCDTIALGEILGCGYPSAARLVNAWMKNPMSKAMILDKDAIAIGTAQVRGKWVLLIQ